MTEEKRKKALGTKKKEELSVEMSPSIASLSCFIFYALIEHPLSSSQRLLSS